MADDGRHPHRDNTAPPKGDAMKTPEEWADEYVGNWPALRGVFAKAIAAAQREAVEAAAQRFDRLADGYHFAGDLKTEKTIRANIEAVRALAPAPKGTP